MSKPGKHNLLYVLECCDETYFKIGICKDETILQKRISTLQTGNPFKINLVHSEFRLSSKNAEQYLHQCFQDKRRMGEWFEGITLYDIKLKLMLFHNQD